MFFLFLLLSFLQKLPFDSKGEIFEWTAGDEVKAMIFPEYQGFVKAEILKDESGTILLRVTVKQDGRFMEDEKSLTEEEYRDIVKRVDSYLKTHKRPNREGWGLFLITNLETGLVEWAPLGCAITGTFTPYPLYAGASFFIPFFLTLHSDITYGQAWLSWVLAHHGYVVGFSFSTLVGWEYNEGTVPFMILIPGIIGDIAGFQYAKSRNISLGMAEMFNHAMISSEFYGAMLLGSILSESYKSEGYSGGAILGAVSGFTLWNAYGKDQYSIGDAMVYDCYSALFLLTDYSVILALPENLDPDIQNLILIGLHLPANLYGLNIFKNNNISLAGALGVYAGTVAGALVGGYIVNLIQPDGDFIAAGIMSLGGWAGFISPYLLIKGKGNASSSKIFIAPEVEFARGRPSPGINLRIVF